MFKRILLVLALICMIVLPVFGQTGTYTSHNLFYLPKYGAYGITEYNAYNEYMEIADAQIWANKTAITTKQTLDAGLTSLAGLTYVSPSFIKVTATDTYAIRTLAEVKADLDLEIGTDIQAFDNALNSISGLTYVSPSFIKLTGNDTYAVRTLAEIKTDLAYQLSDMSDVGVTTPTDKYALIADGDSWESRALVEADISDLGTYLEDITGEELADLSDVGVTTPTDKNALMADGDSWESRALVEADISDLGTYATLTGDEVLTNKDINFVNALGTDHFYSGELDSQPVGENVVFGQLLYYDWTDVEWKLAKADAFTTAKATRIALESKANGETCLMLVKGYIRDDSAFDFGAARVFLNDDTAGTCDDTAPEESGDQIFVVGEAKSADILFFDPGKDVGEI